LSDSGLDAGKPVPDRCSGLLGDLELDRPAGLLLDHGGAVPHLAAAGQVRSVFEVNLTFWVSGPTLEQLSRDDLDGKWVTDFGRFPYPGALWSKGGALLVSDDRGIQRPR